jgi:hypothetical protein
MIVESMQRERGEWRPKTAMSSYLIQNLLSSSPSEEKKMICAAAKKLRKPCFQADGADGL